MTIFFAAANDAVNWVQNACKMNKKTRASDKERTISATVQSDNSIFNLQICEEPDTFCVGCRRQKQPTRMGVEKVEKNL